MDDWDNRPDMPPRGKGGSHKVSGQGWHVGMTLLPLLLVGIVSFGMAFGTQGLQQRPMWLLALTFAAPVLVLMISVLLVEKATHAMTPNYSRKGQLWVALATVALAALIGCACSFTNTEAKSVQTGWSNAIIILDKSGSMYTSHFDEPASNAVVELCEKMNDSVGVGLVVDRGGEKNRSDEMIPIAPLSTNRTLIRDAVDIQNGHKADGDTCFDLAFQNAVKMIDDNPAFAKSLNIIYVTDGDCPFSANVFRQKLLDNQIKVSYLRLGAKVEPELEKLVMDTGGVSLDITELDQLTGTMEKIVRNGLRYYDALRDIDLSAKTKITVGIMMLLLGLLIGFSLTIMFSLQGQKRFQMILSPLMAIVSFVILAFGSKWIPNPAVREGVAFTLLGLVLMQKNRSSGGTAHRNAPSPSLDNEEW